MHFNNTQALNCPDRGLLDDNPALINKTVFLSEGLSSNRSSSVVPLINIEPNPSEELIREVLSSYLITGYIAYEWGYQKNVPIVGIEDKRLYDLSARLWVESQDVPEDEEVSNLWAYTVVARNKNMAKVLIEKIEVYENPILFAGGRHLDKYNDDYFQKIEFDNILKMVDNKIYILCKIFESFMCTLGVYNDSNKVYY